MGIYSGDVPDAYNYLRLFDGDAEGFTDRKRSGQRIGQAFFNSLNESDQWILRGSEKDPFHSNNKEDVANAIRHLVSFGSD